MNDDKPINPEPAPPSQAPFTPRGAIDPRTRAKLGAVLILAIAVFAAAAFFFSRKSAPQPIEPRPTQRMATPEEQHRIEAERKAAEKAAEERAYEEGRRRAAMDAIAHGFPRDDGQNPTAKDSAQQRAEDLAKLEHDAAFADNFVQVADNSEKPQALSGAPTVSASPAASITGVTPATAQQPKLGLPEGTFIPSLLVNKLDGDFTGPVVVQVSNDVYSHDMREIKIPQGARILGEAQRVGQQNQQRLAVTFHRLQITNGPDLHSYSLDAPGLDQQGATALADKVNNHYLQIFGASLAIGAIGGLAQIGNGNYGGAYGYGAESEFRNGITQSMAQSSTQILSRFLNRLPTVTIRPGTRCVVYLRGDI